ncbi:MAG: perphorin family protein [Chlorobiaceae bacterium]|nr:perphorin family protein [Chlorobiaceae bacterium]
MKLNKAEFLIEPVCKGSQIFNARINESGSHMHPAWKPFRNGVLYVLLFDIFARWETILKVKIVITYKEKED